MSVLSSYIYYYTILFATLSPLEKRVGLDLMLYRGL